MVTTDSNHGRRVYPNLAEQMTLSGVNQLWVADITYIRLEAEFIYLAVVIDAFSRRVIGWALDRRVEDDLTLACAPHGIGAKPAAGWGGIIPIVAASMHRGDYTDLLKAHGCEISMSHKSSPWDNASCESWMKTLKYEGVVSARIPRPGRSAGFVGMLYR